MKFQWVGCGIGLALMGGTMHILAIRKSPIASDWTERELLASVLRNEQRGRNELVRRYRGLIYRCITKVNNKCAPYASNADADEVFAEVLMGLLRDDMHKLRMYDPTRGTKLCSWIGMISVTPHTTSSAVPAAARCSTRSTA